jgi:crotonobetainyl-CoA:carnitine CoA-transferase CaiB-like acyl-CoA transferase
MTTSLFKGLKVLDLSTVLAGPSVATFFAELGASVIKIENPITHGDVTRSWKLPTEEESSVVSAYFSSINYGKSYLWMNIADSKHRAHLEQLIIESDIILVNFKHGDDKKFQLTPEEVHQLNSRIIYARIRGYESELTRVAYDVVLQAETGFMEMNGSEESGPTKMPVAMIDVIAAHQLKEGILCALLQREKTQKGTLVECTLEKAGLSALVNQASNFLMTGSIPKRLGSLHPNIAPYGEVFYCSDGKGIVLAVGSNKQFAALVEILGVPEISSNELFSENQQRVINRKALAEKLTEQFKQKTRAEWMKLLLESNVPAGEIKSMDEVMQTSTAQSMILKEEIEGVQTQRIASVAFSME